MTAGADPTASGVADLRTTLAAYAVDRDVVRVAGPDALTYLQGQLSQDVAGLDVGAAAPSFLLQPTGKVDAWLRVTRLAGDELVLDVDGGHGEAVLARLRRFLLRTKADVDPLAWRALALRGPGAAVAGEAAQAPVAAPAPWPGVEAVDLLGPDVAPPAGTPLGDAAGYAALRVASGVPAMGAELTDATIPAEVGRWVVDASVSFTKGCFTGQELVARIDSRGGNVPRRLRGVEVPGSDPVAPGAAVVVEGAEVGHVTSVAPRPGGGTLALAIVRRAVEPPAAARVVGGDGAEAAATVVDLPLAG